jgi:anti-sigma factor RsiW
MMAVQKMLDPEPSEIELLLPWHAAGTLNARDAKRVEEAIARDPALASQYAVIREEYAETIGLNESLGAPSGRAMTSLFAAIDAEPERKPATSLNPGRRIAAFFAGLSPRTLAWSGSLGAIALLLQAGVIGAVLFKDQQSNSFQTASLSENEPITRSFGPEAPRAQVRFAPDARVSDITALLDNYHASIVEARGGMFRLQFGSDPMPRDQAAALLNRLKGEKIVSLVVPTR